MFQFPAFATLCLCIQLRVGGYCPHGFPHSEIPGSKPVCGSPRLIAAYHVLHRLSAPRHPPCALHSLTNSFAVRRAAARTTAQSTRLAFGIEARLLAMNPKNSSFKKHLPRYKAGALSYPAIRCQVTSYKGQRLGPIRVGTKSTMTPLCIVNAD